GVALFLASIKGLLDEPVAGTLFDNLADELLAEKDRPALKGDTRALARARFLRAVARFHKQPLRIAIVTSSLRYEASVVLNEVFNVLRDQIRSWPLEKPARERLLAAFAEPAAFYDAIVTAGDSSEIRLKPHRDLYSLALHRL